VTKTVDVMHWGHSSGWPFFFEKTGNLMGGDGGDITRVLLADHHCSAFDRPSGNAFCLIGFHIKMLNL
jgi:hypothetical protein